MNIDLLVQRARPDSSAGWTRSEQGRRVLDNVIATAGQAAERRPSPSRVPRRPGLRRSLLSAGLATAVTGALVMAVVVSTPTGRDDPADPAQDGARGMLLAAAVKAERAPAGTGRYWHVKSLEVSGPLDLGTGRQRYQMLVHTLREEWDAREPKDASWWGHRELGVRPRGEADEKAWRADGAPTRWTVDADGGPDIVWSTRPGEGTLSKDTRQPRYLWDIGGLSLEQMRQLPEDQAALHEWVTSRVHDKMGFAPGSVTGNRLLFEFLGQLLLDTPASPKVRASAFRILADIPGVQALGTVTDDSGRAGQGVEFADGIQTERLIIDDETHHLLAASSSSNPDGLAVPAKVSSTLVLTAEWSDARPQVPTLP